MSDERATHPGILSYKAGQGVMDDGFLNDLMNALKAHAGGMVLSLEENAKGSEQTICDVTYVWFDVGYVLL